MGFGLSVFAAGESAHRSGDRGVLNGSPGEGAGAYRFIENGYFQAAWAAPVTSSVEGS